MSEFLNKLKPECNLDYCKDALVNSIENYIEKYNFSKIQKNIFLINLNFLQKNIIKLVFSYIFNIEIHQFKSLENELRSFQKRGVSINQNDLKHIIYTINQFNKVK